MIRNLVLKFPRFKCSSEYAFTPLYRKRSFRSLSPLQAYRSEVTTANSPRSVSCPRRKRDQSPLDIATKPFSRTLCYSKDYYAEQEQSADAKWRENPAKENQQEEKAEIVVSKPNPIQFESLEQYELEAARPRPSKSQELIEAFSTKFRPIDQYMHLQPCHMKPYGSPDNLYSPLLIRPSNALKYPRKFKRNKAELTQIEQRKSNSSIDATPTARGQRKFSTSSQYRSDEIRKLSTTNRCISKEGQSTKSSKHVDEDIKYSSTSKLPSYKQYCKSPIIDREEHWAIQRRNLDISPPRYHTTTEDLMNEVQLPSSTNAMRQKRKEEENRRGSVHFKASYSDLIKLKLKEREEAKLALVSQIATVSAPDKSCSNCFIKNIGKTNKMLEAFNILPGRRTLTTRSKSDLLPPNDVVTTKEDQKNFSSKAKKASKSKKHVDPDCGDVCALIRNRDRSKKKSIPYEPAKCEKNVTRPIYLASKVKLPVPPCLARPPYKDCIKVERCLDRADECLQIKPKKLPKLRPNPCPCIDEPPPNITPKLEKLNLKFEDPPKVVCHEPPCQTPRADDSNPYRFKPLKPYLASDCECIPPPPLVDVKLKRLPKCQPEEICRPPRVCPEVERCPPRADECYRVEPKKLPIIDSSNCPCIEPERPTIAPPISRLNLNVPEPERVCRRPPLCPEKPRADDTWRMKKKKLPKFVPGDCPCEDQPMIDWNLKRLVCEDEPEECIVPDPCKMFPRADWGCWEYPPEECNAVDPKCIDNRVKCVEPPKKREPCYKPTVCETRSGGVLDYTQSSRRKFSNSSIHSLSKTDGDSKTKNSTNQVKTSRSRTRTRRTPKKQSSIQALSLINMLSGMDNANSNRSDRFQFKSQKSEKINYDHILKTIASTSDQLKLKEANKHCAGASSAFKKSKVHNTLTVASRAISTTETRQKSEQDMKKEKECESKKKCKNIKPSIKALMCKRTCPRHYVCEGTQDDNAPRMTNQCKHERAPVCCQKEESPYSAFSESMDETIQPYTNMSQWTCNRQQYGFHPVFKKEHDPLNSEKKNTKKHFSTATLLADLPIPENLRAKEFVNPSTLSRKATTRKQAKSAQQNLSPLITNRKSGLYHSPSKGKDF